MRAWRRLEFVFVLGYRKRRVRRRGEYEIGVGRLSDGEERAVVAREYVVTHSPLMRGWRGRHEP